MTGFHYGIRRTGPREWSVMLISDATGDAKDRISSHGNAWNARQRAARLNREAIA